MRVTRRDFLRCAAAFAGAVLPLHGVWGQPRFQRDPFTLGVASGYPQPDGMVLWTRLAPEPLAGGGMPRAAVEVGWEVAADEAFRTIVRSGKEVAAADWAHSVHVEVGGLNAARSYFYRFHAGGAVSPIGRTRTAPAAGAAVERLRFAFASCQQYEQGYYAAYRHMAADDLDLVVHLGDYIYESSWGRNHVRSHGAAEPITLEDYRNRYALYKSDPDLQAAHAAHPWIVTWDDHEVDNDYAADRSQDLDPPALFLRRRAAAYQAYYEHMPLPIWARPRGPDMQLYCRWAFGALAQFHVLDGRQYRSHQACPREGRGGSNVVAAENCRERLNPERTFLGQKQERWLTGKLGASSARWNVIAQQTLMAQSDRKPGDGQAFWTDGWDGYPLARRRLLRIIEEQRVTNPVVIGGDVHMSVIADLKADFDDPRAPVVATEFVGTSISSQGWPRRRVEAWLAESPHIRHANATRRGYTVAELSARRCLVSLRTLDDVRDPQSRIRTLRSFAVEDGKPGAQRA
ncbi:MAG: alkaline phosphatase D family protein [Betaproteobacteria bacterium]|nr:alkaline phosphatase D family protein [Betaproteobacteria bacterium]MDH3436702.1 alkaline phosphatase D family protein [Betaproteobacteria bacterium]